MEVAINETRRNYSPTRIKDLNTARALLIESSDLAIANQDGAFAKIGDVAIEDQGVLYEQVVRHGFSHLSAGNIPYITDPAANDQTPVTTPLRRQIALVRERGKP